METPNLTKLLGASITASLLEKYTLKGLSSIPSSNLYRNSIIREHNLILEYSDSISKQITKLLCNKASLCARVDTAKEFTDGSYAVTCLQDIEKKIAKLVEPIPLVKDKPLVIHTEIKKRRGGKRKTKFKQSQLQKLQNRIQFNSEQMNDIDLDEEEMGVSTTTSNRKLKVNKLLSKETEKRLQKLDTPSHSISHVHTIQTPVKSPVKPTSKWFEN